ncbi:Cas4 family exonuclease [Mycobacterium phage Huphlepuff]|nr:Cas4 family exonuclease [Mycobacterium phage Huphlepuff]
MTDYTIKRGPWGKPYVTRDYGPLDWPQGADKPLNGFLYERPSDISGNLDTKENLSPYHQCQAVTGLMLDKALAIQFKALVAEHGIHTWNNAKQEAKALLSQARSRGGEEHKSGLGSGFHRYAHLRDIGQPIEPEHLKEPTMEDWLDCYEEAMSVFEVLDDECFVVCDDLDNPESPEDIRCAGNFDRLLRARRDIVVGGRVVIPEGVVVIGDIKSGKQDNEYAMKPTIQVGIYAHGVRYEQETGRRWPIHPDLSLDTGVLIHVPYNGNGAPCCDIYPLDLQEGWRLAKLSADITQARKMRAYKRDAIARVSIKERATA